MRMNSGPDNHPRARAAVTALAASKVREVANAGFGRTDVMRFWFGESDATTPAYIRDAAIAALAGGRTFYTHNNGNADLRSALADYLTRLHGRPVGQDRITVTSAGISALMISMQALLDPGDRVVAVSPVWPNLVEIPRILGAEVVRVGLTPGVDAWTLDLDRLIDTITPATRLVLVNSPANPTGWMLDPSARDTLLDHCRRLGVWLLGDDVYERLVLDPAVDRAPSILAAAEPDDRVIAVNSFSKAWLMTGWRLGWIAAPPSLETDLGKLVEYNTSCAPDFVQAGGLAAIRDGEPAVEALRAELTARRDRLIAALRELDGVEAPCPAGGMYVFFRLLGYTDSVALARRLVSEAGLGLAPGAAFGPEGEGWLRWCFAVRPETLEAGIARLADWWRHHGSARR